MMLRAVTSPPARLAPESMIPPASAAPDSSGAGAAHALRPIVFLLFFLSGAVGLVYEVVWLRMLILVFGSTQLAVGTILTAFMMGLALGSFLLGRMIDVRGVPLRVYGWLELLIGLYALAVPALFAGLVPIYRVIWSAFAPDFWIFSLLRFLFVVMVLIVPTTLMGGTLPVLSKFVT